MKQLLSGLVLLLPILPFARAQDSDAKKMFQALEPSVVSITNIEGGGSGIVLSAEGLVLTNFHVANTPLPQTVEAVVEVGGRTVKRKFEKVVLSKVHTQSDLALLKVDPEGCRFKPAKISKSERDTIAGGVCYAMGYPYVPGQDQPVLTITKGIISSARRTVANNPYIQLDAAINPGNSGGALINDKGLVIGVPTLKFEGADRIGLAAPLAGLKMEQFVAPQEKKGNPEEAARLSGLAMDLLMRDTFSFGSNPAAVELAVYLQREALSLEPNNPKWSLNMSWMYFRLQKVPIALAYAESSVRKDPNNFPARKMLADCQEVLNDHKKAAATRLACFEIPPKEGDKADRKSVAEKLASYLADNNDPVRAIYILSWGQASSGETNYTGQRLVMQKAEALIPKTLIDEIMAKTSGHSVADMNAMASRAPAIVPQAEKKPLQPADISKVNAVDVVSKKVTSEVHFKAGVTARLMDSPPGVVFHQDRGTLDWTPLPLTRTAEAKVLFLLTNPDGTEEPYVHIIRRN